MIQIEKCDGFFLFIDDHLNTRDMYLSLRCCHCGLKLDRGFSKIYYKLKGANVLPDDYYPQCCYCYILINKFEYIENILYVRNNDIFILEFVKDTASHAYDLDVVIQDKSLSYILLPLIENGELSKKSEKDIIKLYKKGVKNVKTNR